MNRRSLTQAISVQDPEIAGFLKAGVPKPLSSQGASSGSGQQGGEVKAIPANALNAPRPVELKEGSVEQSPADPPEQMITETGGAIPVTFRLPDKIVRAMISASADRKIRRIKPSTQQSMATEAIEQWLKSKGYL